MNEFLPILFAIILSFAGQRGKSPDDQMRLQAVAGDIWNVVSSAESIPVQGEAGKEATALVMASIAAHESGFWSKVQDCSACMPGSPFCDRGRSISLYQLHVGGGAWLHHTREEICSDNELATSLAFKIIQKNTRAGDVHGLFKTYARGARMRASEEMLQLYQVAQNKAGYRIIHKDGRLAAVWPACSDKGKKTFCRDVDGIIRHLGADLRQASR